MSLVALVLLVAAVVIVAIAEWPRLAEQLGVEARQERRQQRQRQKRKSHLRVVSGSRERSSRQRDDDIDLDAPEPADDFAASVQRDLENLPVVDPHDDRS